MVSVMDIVEEVAFENDFRVVCMNDDEKINQQILSNTPSIDDNLKRDLINIYNTLINFSENIHNNNYSYEITELLRPLLSNVFLSEEIVSIPSISFARMNDIFNPDRYRRCISWKIRVYGGHIRGNLEFE